MNLTFDIFLRAWNKIRTTNAARLQQQVPGLKDPRYISVKRIAEDNDSFTVSFQGFDQALEDMMAQGPIFKRVILRWIKGFASTQVSRGDNTTFIVKISKILNADQAPLGETLDHARVADKYHSNSAVITRISPVSEAYVHNKISKEEAEYVGHPVGGKSCGGCTMFRPAHYCTLVEGDIYAHGHCKHFEER